MEAGMETTVVENQRRRTWVAPVVAVLGLACLAAVLVAPHDSSLGHARLKLEDHWLRATLGEEKLWYGSAAGKPGVILGTWASQRQQQVRVSVPQGDSELRQLGDPVQAGPAARTHRPEAAPRPQLQQRQFLQEEAPADPQQEQPPCSDTCRDKYQLAMSETHTLHNDVEKLQAQCTAMMRLFDCECTQCSPNMAAADELQLTMCSPAGQGEFYAAGGPCTGFAHGFCAAPISQSAFCEEKSWVPAMGSPDWMETHKVIDPGSDDAAGVHLAASQAPAYADKVSNALATYLSSGAVQKLAEARINNELASEIASMKPVHTNMGIFDFLPFDVPFLDQVDKGDKKLLQEDHEAQEADFGEELTPAIAQDYSNKLKDFSSSLRDHGVELPADVATKLHELEDAADRYDGPEDAEPWTRCAEDAQACTCTGNVRFGTLGHWIHKQVSGSVACTPAEFGADPAPGEAKTCECQDAGGWLPSWL